MSVNHLGEMQFIFQYAHRTETAEKVVCCNKMQFSLIHRSKHPSGLALKMAMDHPSSEAGWSWWDLISSPPGVPAQQRAETLG